MIPCSLVDTPTYVPNYMSHPQTTAMLVLTDIKTSV